MIRALFILLFLVSAFVSPAIALGCGILFGMLLKHPFPKHHKKVSKYLLQVAVVGLGFGLNFNDAIRTGGEGLLFTVISVTGVLLIGALVGRLLKLPPRLSWLISSGTAICGGSAIAAVAPVVDANEDETGMSLAVIFTLNAVALFLFPVLGQLLGLTQEQFGWWAAIAIHDTSSVVGAGAAFGPQALALATTVKLTRTLWIIPVSLVSMLVFRGNGGGGRRLSFPWFILLFIAAMAVSTYFALPELLLKGISVASHKFLSMTLFLIGSSLNRDAVRSVGVRPVVLGVALWVIISVGSLLVLL